MAPPAPTFGELYEAHFDYVWHALQRLGVPSRDLEDLVQEVFLTAYRKINEFDPSRPLKPWLFGIALRLSSDFRALARHSKEVEATTDRIADEKKGPDEILASQQASQLVFRALDALDLDKRAVFVMHELHGHVVPEIADALERRLRPKHGLACSMPSPRSCQLRCLARRLRARA